jgi:hypothetical protein
MERDLRMLRRRSSATTVGTPLPQAVIVQLLSSTSRARLPAAAHLGGTQRPRPPDRSRDPLPISPLASDRPPAVESCRIARRCSDGQLFIDFLSPIAVETDSRRLFEGDGFKERMEIAHETARAHFDATPWSSSAADRAVGLARSGSAAAVGLARARRPLVRSWIVALTAVLLPVAAQAQPGTVAPPTVAPRRSRPRRSRPRRHAGSRSRLASRSASCGRAVTTAGSTSRRSA